MSHQIKFWWADELEEARASFQRSGGPPAIARLGNAIEGLGDAQLEDRRQIANLQEQVNALQEQIAALGKS